ncbi:MAG: 16S rRNA (cytidine(1402)-2'-O)-methyltransferase [Candidatus Omnitrophica bacterium]|nr:16S rRNA (cytidine(1402)-2'-O)-methyltransferase [Candidatus Omnitrophota bacterium]
MNESGALYVVATPIGNLQDITLRAIETLKAADLIACEDTRHASILLNAHGIAAPTTSYHSYSSRRKHRRILEALQEGRRVALIADAGLPGISDPGSALIRDAIEAGASVTVIPGASASLVGLVLSGFPTDRFVFEGFLPVKPGARRTRLETLRDEPRAVVLYESPHRLLRALDDIEAAFGDIPMSISRELTKRFEETRRGRISALRGHFTHHPPKGEFVIVLPPQRLRSDA